MDVVVTGSSGLLGSALVTALADEGHRVIRLVRTAALCSNDRICWDPARGTVDPAVFSGCDAVVHLAGESIAEGRWTAAQKARIRDSRVQGTRVLAEALAATDKPPEVLVSASAIGFYGHRGEETVDEDSPAGSGYLASVCRDWEAASKPAVDKGLRVVYLRIGMVLSATGGALAKMLRPFKLGVGGVLGSGEQYLSWIAVDDLVGAVQHALSVRELRGPVNAVAPYPVTNRQFTKTLGRVLRRPTVFPAPAFALRAAFGEMADALLLASTRVTPTRLTDSGFRFRFPQLEDALRHLLGK